MNKKDEQFRIVLGLTDGSDLDWLLDIILDSNIWAPIYVTKEQLEEKYDFSSLPDFEYAPILLVSDYHKEALARLTERIQHEDLNIFISSIF